MAVLALAFAGGALGGAVGGALGFEAAGIAVAASVGQFALGAAGSFIDQTFLFPAIFGPNKQQISGQKIDDFQLTTAAPGSPVYYGMGRDCRVPGAIIWLSKVRTVKEEDEEGGGKGGGATVIRYKYFVSVAVAIAEGPISRIKKVIADGKIIYDATGDTVKTTKKYKSINIYLGTLDQTADPIIQSYDGTDLVTAFRGTAYLVFENLKLHQFGNRMPNFNIEYEAQPQLLLSEAVQAIWTRAGRNVADIDVSFLRGQEVRGYSVVGPQSAAKQLEPLMLAYDFVGQEVNGIQGFRLRTDFTPVVLDSTKFAAHEENQDAPRLMDVDVTAGFDLPAEVNVQFVDPDQDLQKNSRRARVMNPVGPTTSSFDLPVVMDSLSGLALATRTLWNAWAERNQVTLHLPPSMALPILESDVLTFDDYAGNPWRLRVTKVSRGANFITEVRAVTEAYNNLLLNGTSNCGPTPTPTPTPTPAPFDCLDHTKNYQIAFTATADHTGIPSPSATLVVHYSAPDGLWIAVSGNKVFRLSCRNHFAYTFQMSWYDTADPTGPIWGITFTQDSGELAVPAFANQTIVGTWVAASVNRQGVVGPSYSQSGGSGSGEPVHGVSLVITEV